MVRQPKHREISRQLRADIAGKIVGAGMLPEGKTCGAAFKALLTTQHGRYAKAIKDAGIKEK